MAKKQNTRNYDDFLKFAKANKSLTRTEVYWKYREQGGRIKKQTALDLMRDLTKVQKQKSRGETVGKLIKEKNIRQKVRIVDHDYKSLQSPIIEKLYQNIQELYGHNEDQRKFLKVGIKNDNDQYTTVKEFNIFITTDKEKMGVRQLSNEIIKNMKTYYKNLAKKYSTKGNVVGDTLSALSTLEDQMSNTRYPTRDEMERIFKRNGFDLTGYELFEFRE